MNNLRLLLTNYLKMYALYFPLVHPSDEYYHPQEEPLPYTFRLGDGDDEKELTGTIAEV